jgi:uncharacterized protein (DUF427 family)
MAHSPGHRKWPDHKVLEEHPQERVEVYYHGKKIADSTDVIKVLEDDEPPRFYFRREDVQMGALERTQEVTECPFKGTAHYFSLGDDQGKVENAVWTYEEPFEEHKDLKDRLAFYTDKYPDIRIEEKRI